MSKEDSTDRAASRRELARRLRHDAYQRAKEQRAKDPRYLAMKEAVKVRRRELYQVVKERRKVAAKSEKLVRKARETQAKAEKRAATRGELLKLVKRPVDTPVASAPIASAPTAPVTTRWMSKGSDSSN